MANSVWVGGAPVVRQKTQYTPPDPADGEIILSISSRTIVIQGPNSPGVAQSAFMIKAAINGEAITANAETRTGTGPTVGEFSQLTASLDDDTTPTLVYVTGFSDGRPFTLTIEGSSGTAVDTPTGPHHFDNALNFLSGSVPSNGDALIIDHRAQSDIRYAIETSTTLASITTLNTSRSVGLSPIASYIGGPSFVEHLPTYFKILTTAPSIRIEDDSPMMRIWATGLATVTVQRTGPRTGSFAPCQLLTGTNSILYMLGGDVGMGEGEAEASTIVTIKQTGGRLYLGSGVTGSPAITAAGEFYLNCAASTLVINGGKFVHQRGVTSSTIKVNAGVYDCRTTGTCGAITVAGGATADFRNDPQAVVFGTGTLLPGASWLDPDGKVTYGGSTTLVLSNCSPADLRQLLLPKNKTYTLS